MKCALEIKERLNEVDLDTPAYTALTLCDDYGCDYLHRRFMDGALVLVVKDGMGALLDPNPNLQSLLESGETVELKTWDAYQ